MLTIQDIRKKFPEARETVRGSGPAFTVNCWKYHKFGGKNEMEIGANDGVFHCHNCGHSGNLYTEFPEFFDPLSELFPDLFVKREAPTAPAANARVRRGGIMWTEDIQAPGEVIPFAKLPDEHVAVEYLRRRGFDIEEMRAYDETRALYYCTRGQISMAEGKGSTTGRIVFPIYMLGRLKGWQARQIDYVVEETELTGEKVVWNGDAWQKFKKVDGHWEDRYVPKYYTCPGMKRSSVLYGFDMARNYQEVAVVEGPLDYHRTGPQCVGTIGKMISRDQVNLMKTYWSRLFYLRDPGVDPEDRAFKQLLMDLAPVPVYHLCLAGGKDPGATRRESTWQQIAEHVHNASLGQPAGRN